MSDNIPSLCGMASGCRWLDELLGSKKEEKKTIRVGREETNCRNRNRNRNRNTKEAFPCVWSLLPHAVFVWVCMPTFLHSVLCIRRNKTKKTCSPSCFDSTHGIWPTDDQNNQPPHFHYNPYGHTLVLFAIFVDLSNTETIASEFRS